MGNEIDQDNWRLNWMLAAALCLLAVCCYHNSLTAPFILDDHGNILNNPAIESFWPGADEARLASRRPIGHLSLALNYALARWRTGDGLNVRAYHTVNLTIHILAGLILFDLIRRTLRLESLRQRYGPMAAYLAFAVAAIWLVHPLQTSSVTYVIQRLESLMSLFYLLCLYGLLRGSQAARWQGACCWYLVTIAAFWLGLGTKEVIATAVVVAPLYDRIFLSDSWRTVLRRRGAVYLGFVPAILWFAVAVAPAFSPDSGLTTGFGVQSVTPLEYLCSQAGVLLHYLRLVFWPHPLCLDYAWPIARTTTQIVLPGLVIVGLLAASLFALFRWPRIGFLGTAFFLILSPTSSFVPIQELAFEYRMYLPLAPLVILLVLGVVQTWNRLLPWLVPEHGTGKRNAKRASQRRQLLQRIVPATMLATVVAVFSFLTVSRNQDYGSEKSIWLDTVSKRPSNGRAHVNLGNVYLGEGDFAGAIQSYGDAIKAQPDNATAYNNRGRVYSDLKKYPQALADYDRAIELDPGHAKAYHNRGILQTQSGDYQAAISDLTKALSLETKADTYFSRGNAYLLLGKLDLAIDDFSSALKMQPDSVDALLNRGRAHRMGKRFDEAIHDLSAVIDLRRDLADAFSNRAFCYYRTQQYALAWNDVRQAQRTGGQVPAQLIRWLEAATGQRE